MRPIAVRRLPTLPALGAALWGLFTSVRFAVLQIVVVVVAALVGMTIRQLPSFAVGPDALPGDYAAQMDLIHQRYDPTLGRSVVGLFETLGFFQLFNTAWFSALLLLLLVSIVVCTLDRLPRLWREARTVRVYQPDPFFDPGLPGRAVVTDLDQSAVVRVLRRHRFRVREERGTERAMGNAGEGVFLYGDRNQYTKLATLLTHLGLILFILAAAITARGIPELGITTADVPVVLAVGGTQTIQPIGTPDLLVVKNLDFEAPRLPNGQFADFTTDLAVYRNGVEIARKVIRVNDPLSVAGYTFHQNFFGPAVDLDIRDSAGAPLWTGPIPLDDPPINGQPYRRLDVPARNISLDLLLLKADDGSPRLIVTGNRPAGLNPDGSQKWETRFAGALQPGTSAKAPDDGFSIGFTGMSSYTGIIARKDPGAYVVWLAFLCLMLGLLVTFYLPRRRVWARLDTSGVLSLVGRSDRYVDFEREFGSLLEDLVAVRHRARGGPAARRRRDGLPSPDATPG